MCKLLSVSLLLALSAVSAGSTPPVVVQKAPIKATGLVIEGETTIIVTKVPFKVIAPPGAKLYYWGLPTGWKGDAGRVSKKNEVTITEASEGTGEVTLITVDKDFETADYSIKVNVGKLPGPVPPPVPPTDPLVLALKAAYATEADPAKLTQLQGLAALYRQASKDEFIVKYATWGGVFGAMKDAAGTLGLVGKLPGVQKALREGLLVALPTDPAATLDAGGRSLAASTFARAALVLEASKP